MEVGGKGPVTIAQACYQTDKEASTKRPGPADEKFGGGSIVTGEEVPAMEDVIVTFPAG